ncbi:MAG TPA: hypothetical protein VK071_03110 [Tissierellales bacterium]|nr:hypothetical protein [Tissierellales bacterium]
MLSVVGDKSVGLLSIEPKTKDGTPIEDYEAQIIYDSTSGRNNEVKEWLAIAGYLKSFDEIDGTPQVPQYYKETQGRKIVDNNKNIFAILKNPNAIALGIYTIIIVLIITIIFIIKTIVKRRKRKKTKIAID